MSMDEPNKLQRYEAEIAARQAARRAQQAEYADMVSRAKANREAGTKADPGSIPTFNHLLAPSREAAKQQKRDQKSEQREKDEQYAGWWQSMMLPPGPRLDAYRLKVINPED